MQTRFWQDFLEETESQRKGRRGDKACNTSKKWLGRIRSESVKVTFRNNPGKVVYKFTDLDLSGLNFSYVAMYDVLFEKCNFKGAKFNDSYFANCWFDQCNFTNAEFLEANLRDLSLKQCVFENASFVNAYVRNCSFKNSTLKTALLYGCALTYLSKHPIQYPAVNTHYQIGSKLYKLNPVALPFPVKRGEEFHGMIADSKTIIIATARDDIPTVIHLKHESELFSFIVGCES